jgi:DNA uptake protein ComE-like DNA-binding protein
MNRDFIRSLAKAISGRVKSFLVQAAKDEAARAVRHFRARMQQSPQPADSAPSAPPQALASAPPAPTATSSPLPDTAVPQTPPPEEPRQAPQTSAHDETAAAKPAAERSAAPQDGAPAEAVVNINAASKVELIALPGIGEARADAIIKARPFATASERVERKVLPASVFENLKSRIGVA